MANTDHNSYPRIILEIEAGSPAWHAIQNQTAPYLDLYARTLRIAVEEDGRVMVKRNEDMWSAPLSVHAS